MVWLVQLCGLYIPVHYDQGHILYRQLQLDLSNEALAAPALKSVGTSRIFLEQAPGTCSVVAYLIEHIWFDKAPEQNLAASRV